MRRNPVVFVMKIAILLLIVVLGFGQAVLHLWNWLMPPLFGLHTITFWQGLGLMGLSWILFRGGFLGRPQRWNGRRGRWGNMSPEQREKFREAMGRRCGHFESKATQPAP